MKYGVAAGYVNLYLAVRDMDGGPDDKWRAYWQDRPEMKKVWEVLSGVNSRLPNVVSRRATPPPR